MEVKRKLFYWLDISNFLYIIVLLILAGVTIMMLMGSENAPQKASEAVEKDAIAGAKDEVAMEAQSALLDYFNKKYVEGSGTDGTSIQSEVAKSAKKAVDSAKSKNKQLLSDSGVTDNTITLKTKSYTVTGTIDENGSITWGDIVASTEKNTETKVLTADKITADHYGDYVAYNIDINNNEGDGNREEWRVFYAKDDRIFLIATDYVDTSSSALTKALAKCSGLHQDGKYGTSWNEKYNDIIYDCTESVIDGKEQCIFPELFEFSNYKPGDHIDNISSKCVSELLCTDNWKSFLDNTTENGFGEYAIGGPTLEMFINSWNKHDKNIYKHISWKINEFGYLLSKDGTSYDDVANLDCGETPDSLYVIRIENINHTYSTHNYWISATDASDGFVYTGEQGLGVDLYEYTYGIRPVVCLKAGIKLIDSGDIASDGKTIYNLQK